MYTNIFIEHQFYNILEKSGNPPLNLVSRKVFKDRVGGTFKGNFGISNTYYKIIWINKNHPNIFELRDTIWHEVLHCLFTTMPEWWVEIASHKLANNKSEFLGLMTSEFNKTLRDVPSKKQLLIMCNAISENMNA
jgi:hypothetical protein